MHVPFIRRRHFTSSDRIGAPKVVMVNEAAAKAFWPNESPIGKHIMVGQGGMRDAEIIGVVGGVRTTPDSVAGPAAYIAYAESPRQGMIVFVRTQRDAASFAPAVTRAVREIGPQFPVFD